MLSDYVTTAAAARKQIEQSLVKTGDSGFGAGIVYIILRDESFTILTLENDQKINCPPQAIYVPHQHRFPGVLFKMQENLVASYLKETGSL